MDFMYAQVEQFRAVQDYAPYKSCIRLVGVKEADFESRAFNALQGCATHFIDIAWDHLFELMIHGYLYESWLFNVSKRSMCHGMPDEWPDRLWLRLGYEREPDVTGAYYYEIFSDEEDVVNIAVNRMELHFGPSVAPAPIATSGPSIGTSQAFSLSAFHVGQGMCALLYGNTDGFLLDAGAGTPLKRKTYRKWLTAPSSVSFTNDLRARTNGLALQAVISHPDSDHWRLLDWDPKLLVATRGIFTPAGTAALALKSSRTISRVSSLAGTTVVTNGPHGPDLLKAHRSNPSVVDRNGECLVVETRTGAQALCLFAGDYVYDRMAVDGVADIVALSAATPDAVMVPHHGDAASASVLVKPRVVGTTKAFFSAGTHAGYGHPTAASLSAHTTAGFLNVDNHTCTNIIEQPLP
jgi:hypothetical protein